MKQIILPLAVLILMLCCNTITRAEPDVYNQLIQSWNVYKRFFIQDDGRVIDFKARNISTSEGQSYALLRSVWLNDKNMFDKVLNWTNTNLKVRGDNLFGWKWGENKNGNWTIIDKANATDADQDIAFALILAYEKWNKPEYLNQAKKILHDLWSKNVIKIKNYNYMAAGEWALNDENVKLNPSYLSPYEYRIFAKYDKDNNWIDLVKSSYKVLNESSQLTKFYLPPNWAYINKRTGQIAIDKIVHPKESDYSYDAIRTHWRIAMDYEANKDKQALKYLQKSTKYLIKYWKETGSLPTSITADGISRPHGDSDAVYGAVLPAIAIINNKIAEEIYYNKINSEYAKGFWGNPRDYYAQNIIWFGIALFYNIDNKKSPLFKRGIVNLLN